MMLLKINILIIFVKFLKFSNSTLVGTCNECFPSNNVTCIDENHFSICINGVPTGLSTPCPGNSVCTDDIQICRSLDDGFTPICYREYCGNCDATNGVFSCLDETTYGYCFGESEPYEESIRSCPDGFVCNYNFPDICVSEDMNEPSCLSKITTDSTTDSTTEIITDSTTDTTSEIITGSTTEVTSETPHTTTTLTPRHPDVICEGIGQQGYYKSDDPTCREYIYCYPLSGQYFGRLYYCDGYFNAATQKCQVERPVDCVEY